MLHNRITAAFDIFHLFNMKLKHSPTSCETHCALICRFGCVHLIITTHAGRQFSFENETTAHKVSLVKPGERLGFQAAQQSGKLTEWKLNKRPFRSGTSSGNSRRKREAKSRTRQRDSRQRSKGRKSGVRGGDPQSQS